MSGERSKEELLDLIERTAHDYEAEYHGCAQCGLMALQEHLGIGNEETLRSVSGLAGGTALMGDSCGALLAGMVALGIVFGRRNIENFVELSQSMKPVRKLYRSFQEEFGSCLCRDVMASKLGKFYDLACDYEDFEAAGGYEHCPKVVGKAARLTAELILEEREKQAAT